MTDQDVYENMDLGFPALQCPKAYPPSESELIMQFWVNPEDRGPLLAKAHDGAQFFRFVMTQRFPNGKAIQIWEWLGEWYCSRIGQREQLRHCGDSEKFSSRYRDLYPEDDDHE